MDSRRMALESQIRYLIGYSGDALYSDYLRGLLAQLGQQAVTVEYAAWEVQRTYQLYVQRMQAYSGQPQYVQQPQYAQQPQYMQQPQYAQQPQYVQQPQYAQQLQYVQQPQYMQQSQYVQQPQYAQLPYASQPQYIQQPWHGKPERKKPKRKSVEFSVGAGVFSMIGILFILVSLVMLGQTYMNRMIKGLCLYGIALMVFLASELMIKRRMPKAAIGITGFGISGLYLSTVANCLYLQNFNVWVAVAISLLISLLAVLVGRKKDSATIKIISFLGCYISVFLLGNVRTEMTGGDFSDVMVRARFLLTAAVLLIVNLMTVFMPITKYRIVIHIFHMTSNAFFTVLYVLSASFGGGADYAVFFMVSSLLVQGLIFYSMMRPNKEKEKRENMAGGIALYIAINGVLILIFFWESIFVSPKWHIHAAMGCFLLVCMLLFFLFRKSSLKWIQYWMFCFAAVLVYHNVRAGSREDGFYWWRLGITLGIFLVSRFLSRIKILWISDMVITGLTVLSAMIAFVQKDWLYSLCYIGAFVISMAALHHWKEIYEGIVLFVLEAFVAVYLQNELTIVIMFAILFLGVIGFNSIAFFRGKYQKIFNYVCLGGMGCLCIAALFYSSFISGGVLLILGAAFMFLAFREEFGMHFRCRNLIFLFVMCYMLLIWDIPVPVVKSILMMLAAIGAVAVGFIGKERKLRISGLVLTLLVCGKMVLLDFSGAATLEKMVLFLVAGIIVLAISGMYIALEKKIV